MLVDPATENATGISAGIINPVTGRKYKPQWHIEVLLPLAERIYSAMETDLEKKILHHCGIYKMHKSEEALEPWLLARTTSETKAWVDENAAIHPWQRHLDSRFGAITVPKAKRVDTALMIQAFTHKYRDQCIADVVRYDDINLHDDHVTWKGSSFKHVIFCEGARVTHNPWFNKIQLWPAKGECLVVQIPHLQASTMLQKKVFIVPMGSDLYWVGATNDVHDATDQPTEKAKEELLDGLRDMLKLSFTVVAHRAGLRPTMRDRTPVVGTHPEHRHLHILNGLGTKGSLLAPYYAGILLDHILYHQPIPAPADVRRIFR